MSERMIPADEAKSLLDATGLRRCDLEHFASYDPEGQYPPGARSLVYIDGYEDVDGLGNYQPTGGPICDGVPEEVAPLFAAAPDLAHTVVEQAAQIERVREARSMINRIIANAERGVDLGDPATLAKSIVNKLNNALGDTDD